MHAVKYDNDNNTGRAMDYYCQALDYFIPALECTVMLSFTLTGPVVKFVPDEDDHSTKEALHQKVRIYSYDY